MNREKNQWRNEMATIILAIVRQCEPSEEFTKIQPGEPFFEDSCKFIEMRHQLFNLVDAFRTLNHLSELIAENSANEDHVTKK